MKLGGKTRSLGLKSQSYTMISERGVTPPLSSLYRRGEGGSRPKMKLGGETRSLGLKSQSHTMISEWGVTPLHTWASKPYMGF